jgi:hypothetical protein
VKPRWRVERNGERTLSLAIPGLTISVTDSPSPRCTRWISAQSSIMYNPPADSIGRTRRQWSTPSVVDPAQGGVKIRVLIEASAFSRSRQQGTGWY